MPVEHDRRSADAQLLTTVALQRPEPWQKPADAARWRCWAEPEGTRQGSWVRRLQMHEARVEV